MFNELYSYLFAVCTCMYTLCFLSMNNWIVLLCAFLTMAILNQISLSILEFVVGFSIVYKNSFATNKLTCQSIPVSECSAKINSNYLVGQQKQCLLERWKFWLNHVLNTSKETS